MQPRTHTPDRTVTDADVDLVVIEDFVTRSPAASLLGMVHGAVRLHLWGRGAEFVMVPPASLKRYATGKGNATKADMRMALFQRAGLDVRDDNAADAWWLRAMGLDALGAPVVALPQTHRQALDKVVWPDSPTRTPGGAHSGAGEAMGASQ